MNRARPQEGPLWLEQRRAGPVRSVALGRGVPFELAMPPTLENVVRASAPGRVNLIGEHTDYNGGFVLPAAIPQRTAVELTTRGDSSVVVSSSNIGGRETYMLGAEERRSSWVDYVQGITSTLALEGHRL